MQITYEMLQETTTFLSKKLIEKPVVGIVLGTGLHSIVSQLQVLQSIPYQSIPHFPEATVESHKGNLVYGFLNKVPVLLMQGRFHYYEGYSMQQITFPIRVMQALGIEYLVLSNTAGGLNSGFKKEDLVLIDDHINLLPENPIRGVIDHSFGNRFVDMSDPYSKLLCQKIIATAQRLAIPIKQGVYVAVPGPSLETRAEYRYLKNMGADMVGMSTVPEVIVANQVGLPCAAISVITDECNPNDLKPVNISEIIEVARRADNVLARLIAGTVAALV